MNLNKKKFNPKIREESVTKSIMFWLEKKGWKIICFDFPQSGTGKVLHPNNRLGIKNKDTIIPDIVALKNNIVLFFENKDRFYPLDFQKIHKIKEENSYSEAIKELLFAYNYKNIYYGIGLPITPNNNVKVVQNHSLVDFVVDTDGLTVNIVYQDSILTNEKSNLEDI